MEAYDANKDGKLAADELKASPAIIDAMPRIDKNYDKAADQSEMEARFAEHEGLAQVISFDLRVTANRRPLECATVTFSPEPFMGEGKQSYVGVSNSDGDCLLKGEEVKMPGLPTGFYKVHIVQQASGVDATLGCEVAGDSPTANRMAFDVKAPAAGATNARGG
jgi:hypothetical protein